MVTQLTRPFTPEAKMLAMTKEARASFEKFLQLYRKHRTWDAVNPPELADMSKGFERLSPETKTMIEVVTLVESRVGHYVEAGLRAAGSNEVVQDLYMVWGEQEWKHKTVLRRCCTHSGLRSEKVMSDLIADTLSRKWTFEEQVHLEEGRCGTACEAAFYGKNQEFETGDNYGILIDRIWRELGEEMDSKGNPVYRGIAAVLRNVKIDETYHEGQFTDIARLWLKYFPDKALEAMMTVYKGYTMPLIKVRDPERVLKAVVETGFDSGRKKVMKRGFTDLGLSGFVSLRKALQEVRSVSPDAVVQRPGAPILDLVGVPILEIQPTGELPLVKAA